MTVAIVPACAALDYITTVESTPNLLGYWRFSTASQANSEVNGFTGTFNGGSTVGPASSGPTLAVDPTNTAALFNGTSGSVTTNLSASIDQQGSIIGWFNLSALPSTGGHIFYIAGSAHGGNDFDLEIETDNKIKFYTSSGSTHVTAPTAFTAADLNVWHFFAATFKANGDRNIYLDGSLPTTDVPGAHSLLPAVVTMGEINSGSGRLFDGKLDEIAIYNRDLTSTEVSNIFASSLIVPEPCTIGLLAAGFILSIANRRKRQRI